MQLYSVLSSGGQVAMRGIDLAVSSRLTWLASATALAYLAAGLEHESLSCGTRVWFNWLPDKRTSAGAAAYAGGLVLMGAGLGRYPLSGRLIAYSVVQALMVVIDGYIVGRLALRPNWEGYEPFLNTDRKCDVRRSVLPLVVVAIWFGGRLLDGWYRASMPVDVLPFASLAARTGLGSRIINPLLSKISTWSSVTAFLSKVIPWGSAIGQRVMRGTDWVLNSQLFSLLFGVTTTYLIGGLRACELQDSRRKRGEFCAPGPSTREKVIVVTEEVEGRSCGNWQCKAHHYTQRGKRGRYHNLKWQEITWASESSLSWSQWLIGGKLSALLLGTYALGLLLGVTAGGRIPLSGCSAHYLTRQLLTKWLDSLVLTTCCIDRMGCNRDGEATLDPTGVYLPPKPLAMWWVAYPYFGLRLVDGYLRASMPMNTAPWSTWLVWAPRFLIR
jgi:hypothetical protein